MEDLEFAEGGRSVRALRSAELRLSKLKQNSWCWWQKVWSFRAKVWVYRFVGTEKLVRFPDLLLFSFSKRCFL